MAGLIPPDPERCQACPNVARHSPFSLGPRPVPKRCQAKPVWLAVEKQPGPDGNIGSMTLCQSCCELMLEITDKGNLILLRPINRDGVGNVPG